MEQFNLILVLEKNNKFFLSIIEEILFKYNPSEVYYSKFNLKSEKIQVVNNFDKLDDENVINKVILITDTSNIIIEYYKGIVEIEYLQEGNKEELSKDIDLLKRIIRKEFSYYIIIGFEVSIDIMNPDISLKALEKDSSLYPIAIISKKAKDRSFLIKEKYLEIKSLKVKLIKDCIRFLFSSPPLSHVHIP